jgi:Zn-dependent protease with chaperone function
MTSSIRHEPARYTAPDDSSPITVARWPSEEPLFALAALISAGLWLLLTISVIGLVYAGFFAIFFAMLHLAFITHVRGSAVRLGPDQFPELHGVVERLARRMGMTEVPATYLMQAGGTLNAFATRFLRSHIIVLYSDLLEACGENTAARDMIIAHELGHIKSGHLRWHWFLLPAGIVPFLLTALSRAREYTCDRYGLAGAGSAEGAGLGLAILAAGAKHGPSVNRQELVRQRADVERSGLMTIGEWLGTHPPLSKRLAAIDPSLGAGVRVSRQGAVRAGLSVIAIPLAILAIGVSVLTSKFVRQIRTVMDSAQVASRGGSNVGPGAASPIYKPPADAAERARKEVLDVAQFIEADRRNRPLPWNASELYQRLAESRPDWVPLDPYDGTQLGYQARGSDFVVFSSGADGEPWTDDDIRYDSRVHAIVRSSNRSSATANPK